MPRAQYQMQPSADHLSAAYTPSAGPTSTSVAFHSDPTYGASLYPAGMSAHAPPVAQYGATNTQQTGMSAHAYSR